MKKIWLASALAPMLVVGAVAVAFAQDSSESTTPARAPDGEQIQAAEDPTDLDDENLDDENLDEGGFGDEDSDEEGFDDECDDFDEELTPELIEEINTETAALVEHLSGLGFDVTVITDDDGVDDFDYEDNADIDAAIDAFYDELFAAEAADWSDEDKAEWNAEVDELVAELEAEGISVETTEIAPGVRDIVWTDEIDEAFDDEWTDDEWTDDFDDFEEESAAGNAP